LHIENIVSKKQPAATKATKAPASESRPMGHWIWSWLLFAAGFLLYANTFGHGYAFDDAVAITENKFTQKGLAGIGDLLTKDFFEGIYGDQLELVGGRYRPLSLITFAAEKSFFGQNPALSHVLNALLYGFSALLLFRVLRRLAPQMPLLAFCAALLWTMHPLHTEVVANIKSRDEILSFIGLFAALGFLLRYLDTPSSKWLTGMAVAYFLALLSKENGITFLAVLPLTVWAFRREKLAAAKPAWFILGGIAVLYLVLRTAFVGLLGKDSPDIMENPFVHCSFGEKYATIFVTLWKYLALHLWPWPLSCDYSFNQVPIVGFTDPVAVASLLLHVGIAAFAGRSLWRRDAWMPAAWGVAFYLLTLSIASNLVFNIGAPMGERFVFLPSAGLLFSLVFFLGKLLKSDFSTLRLGQPLGLACVAIALLFAGLSWQRNAAWKDNLTLFGTDARTSANSAKLRYYYGCALLNPCIGKNTTDCTEKIKQAEEQMRRSVEINPQFHHAWYNLGLIYSEQGKGDSTVACCKRVLALQPKHIFTQQLLGKAYGRYLKQYDLAIEHLKTAIQYNPQNGPAFEDLGICYAMKGEVDNAIENFEKALPISTNKRQIYGNLAAAWQQKGDLAKADQYAKMAAAQR
jgi:protein O-mannosyl-transferase